MISLINKVKSAVETYNMINNGDHVVIGLSGGADSVALLHALLELRSVFDISVSAVHVNHQLRGDDSDNDEKFCRQLCSELDVAFSSERVDVKAYMKKYGKSSEESARILRYDVFSRHSEDGKIATAHTLSDNAETVIHNLARGTGLKGLTGIPPVRDNIIRPLIMVTRNEVEDYLKTKSQKFVTDCTNLTDDYTRNKIRHHVIPELEKINQSFLKTMMSNISALQTENSFISRMCDETYEKCLENSHTLKNLADYHKAVRHRCIARFLNDHNLRYSHDRISAIDNILFSNGKINIAENVYIVSYSGILSIEYFSPHAETDAFSYPLECGIFRINDKKSCSIKIISDKIPDADRCVLIDYDKTTGRLILRSRKNGDKIRLAGKNFTSSVKKSLINMKIPVAQRSQLCFIEDDSGLIFAEKMGIAERVVPDENTVRFLCIYLSEN